MATSLEYIESIESLKEKVKCDFVKAVTQIINEIDLCFEYIPLQTKTKLNEYSESIQNDESFRNEQMKLIWNTLQPYEKELYQVSYSKKKIKTMNLTFLDSIKMFNGKDNSPILDFSLFTLENKNTKVSLINYLNSEADPFS